MAAFPQVFQGENKSLVVSSGAGSSIDLTLATEIEFRIDTPKQIIKTLSNGDITANSATQFTVLLVPGDTETITAGPYKYQARVTTAAGDLVNGKFTPNKLEIKDSIFTTAGSGNDYS